jgi:hypothetical protein
MGKHAQIERSRKVVSVFVPTSGRGSSKPPIIGEWQEDLLTPGLFRTCIKLQTSLDRRFRKFGMTVQEANRRPNDRVLSTESSTPLGSEPNVQLHSRRIKNGASC